MIRDPSDGSVKETPKSAPDLQAPQNTAERLPSSDAARSGANTLIDPTTSGLQTGSTKPEYQARLEKAREWIRDYRAGKT